jgi:hypothetical protein
LKIYDFKHRFDEIIAVAQVVSHQKDVGQEDEAEPTSASMDSSPHWQHDSVITSIVFLCIPIALQLKY